MTTQLESKYFQRIGGGPVFSGSTDVEPIADGVAYFNALDTAIAATIGAGDAIYILGWRFDAAFDFRGRTGAAAVPVSQLLAAKRHAGVDVRIVLWTGVVLGDPGSFPFANPCQDNLRAARTLRKELVPGSSTPPLADRVLLDWSGASTGSHHMKAVTVVSGGGANMVAFSTGIDPWKYRRDSAPHTQDVDPKDGSPFGWHDAAVRLNGAAARAIYDTFVQRWREASTLPPKKYYLDFNTALSEPVNPPSAVPPLPAPPSAPTISRPQQAVQVMRSRYAWKYAHPLSPRKQEWDGPPLNTGGFYEVFETLKKAILAARRYIYIEDQYLGDSPSSDTSKGFSLLPHLAAVAAARDVKLIFVGSGRGDPDDPPGQRGPANQTFASVGRGLGGLIPGLKASVADELQNNFGIDPASRISVWRLKPATVHSKVMVIDDRFLAIGSANIHSRSMVGEDSELHVAIVDEANLIRDFRIALWSEHFNLPDSGRPAGVQAALEDLDIALGLWRSNWLPTTAVDSWIVPDRPVGFLPLPKELEFVGPT
jgi:phosphatidylserine/phosphatidylglycerophosphate/cardiolipin synthase-like enzyme